MCRDDLIVLKFGGSVLRDEDHLRLAVHEIHRHRRVGRRVVAVVSALAGATDALLAQSLRLSERSDPVARATLLATGELHSAALLGLHLDRAGIPATVLAPAAIRLVAEGPALDATPVDLDRAPVDDALARDGIVVIPGYAATNRAGRTVVLGRGGSDLTALFLADRLGATRCRLVKDVDGLYERDPATPGPVPRRYASATWDDALHTDGSIVQHKAVRFAAAHEQAFELGAFNRTDATIIGPGPTRLVDAPSPRRPLTVALLGLGTVGWGVHELLRHLPGEFTIVGIAVRRPDEHPRRAATIAPMTADVVGLASRGVDLVIEALGGLDPALPAIEGALRAGAHVVTANKTLLASHGAPLRALASSRRVALRGSASVGGAMPLLERLGAETTRSVRSIRAVLNGTTNAVLDLVADGATIDEAIAEARRRGFTEADPTRDLAGFDAADKLRIIADTIGATLDGEIPCDRLDADAMPDAATPAIIRQVARLTIRDGIARAAVRLEPVPDDDPLARVREEHNVAVIEWNDGSCEILRGRGAGRWPTAESVVADALDCARLGSVGPRDDRREVCRA
ncbi:MAG: hypothetical protein KDA25_11050 [Phycisphaerales bacterium]|nr:hypothetical protein [Phycisphaerales bacterium]